MAAIRLGGAEVGWSWIGFSPSEARMVVAAALGFESVLVGVNVVFVSADAQAGRIVCVVVEYCSDICEKIGIVGDTHNHLRFASG